VDVLVAALGGADVEVAGQLDQLRAGDVLGQVAAEGDRHERVAGAVESPASARRRRVARGERRTRCRSAAPATAAAGVAALRSRRASTFSIASSCRASE
jgi:hypothetical protein